MTFSRVTELDRHYLVCDYSEENAENHYVLEMLTHNTIPGILSVSCRRMDGCCQLYMEIDKKQGLCEKMAAGQMTDREELSGLLKAILQAAEQIHDYLLEGDMLVLKPECIFWSETGKQWYFVCCPGQSQPFMEQIVSLMEYFMQQMDYKNRELVSLVYDCYQMGKRSESGISDYRDYVKELDKKHEVPPEADKGEKEEMPGGILPLTPEMEQSFPFETVREENCSEREVRCHSKKTWCICLLGSVLSVAALAGAYAGGFFENEVTGLLEPVRLFVAAGIGVVLNVLWYQKHLSKKEYKIVTEVRYSNPREHLEPVKKEAQVKKEEPVKKDVEYPVEKETGQDFSKKTAENEEETIQLAGYGAEQPTVLLSDGVRYDLKEEYYLQACAKEYEDIHLVEYPFFIGKLKKNINYTIDREVISRYHVKLEKGDKEGELIVTDLNSTNGTYINGKRLEKQERGVLGEGDQLTLADVSYRFVKEKP